MPRQYHKIIFELKPDEDNYPPVTAESLWGILREPNSYEIDNAPYYAYGISKGDYVSTINKNSKLVASKVIQEFLNDPNWCFLIGSNCYSHSTIWVI